MKIAINKSLQWFFTYSLVLAFCAAVAGNVAASNTEPEATCPTPTVSVTAQGSNDVSFSWNAVSGAVGYRVWYTRREDNFTSSVANTGNTSISFSSLPAGTYDFYFATVCGSGVSGYVVVDDLVML